MADPEIHTFGCRLNAFESEVIRSKSKDRMPENTIIFNSCAVTNEAVRQVRQSIRKTRKLNPEANIVVTGCAAQIDPDSFAEMPEVNLVLGNEEKFVASNYSPDLFRLNSEEKVLVNDIMQLEEVGQHLIDGYEERARAFVQVQNGCDHRCTFCIIPYGRGNSRSVPQGAVVDQVKHLVDNGYNEVVLTGVDMTSYGADLPGKPSLGKLVQAILNHVPDLKRLRLSSIDTIEIDDALYDVVKSESRFMPHLHLSLQAGSNMILKRMKRRHLREDAINACRVLRELRPDIVFGADLIAGFPTETDEMFEDSLRLVDECGLTYLHVFPFSPRPGTPAAKMPQVTKSIIKDRAKILRQKGEQVTSDFYRSLVGSNQNVLVESEGRGRLEQFAPVKLDLDMEPGSVVTMRITNYVDGQLVAEAA